MRRCGRYLSEGIITSDARDGRVREAHGRYPGARVEHRVRTLQDHEETPQTTRAEDDRRGAADDRTGKPRVVEWVK